MPHLHKALLSVALLLSLWGMAAISAHPVAQAAETPADFTCAAVTTIPAAECGTLIEFFNSTSGSGWTNNTGWLQDDNPCTWYGITCAGGHVTRLFFWDNNLIGPLPHSLATLSQLETLDLGNNPLTGSLPASLGQLSNLRQLRIYQSFSVLPGRGLIGPLPETLGTLTNLTRLELFGDFSGMIPLSLLQLTQLQVLYLGSAPCVPGDAVVEEWLATIPQVTVFNRNCTLLDATNVFVNGSFEAQYVLNPEWWAIDRTSFFTDTAPFTDIAPRTGRSAALLGIYQPGAPEVDPFRFDRIQQTVEIPYREHVAFSFYYQIRSEDECGRDYALVFAKLSMQPPVQIGAFELCQSTQTRAWTEASFDLTEFRGKTADIYIDVRLSEMNGSAFYMDDLYLAQNQPQNVELSNPIFLPAIQSSSPPPAPYTLTCNPSGGSGGLLIGAHITQVAGLQALVVVGNGYDPARPTFLSFYLHGDGGDYRAHEGGPVREIVDQQGWIFVAPLAPSPYIIREPLPFPNRWNPDGILKSELLAAVFEEMFARYNLCRDLLLGSGASGGPVFWDQFFFPLKGDVYPAFFSYTCGGADPSGPWYRGQMLERVRSYDALKARSRFHYRIGTEDFLFGPAQAGATAHANAGFDTIFEPLEGVGHCAFDIPSTIREHWQRAVDDFNLNGLRP
ncbi:MAG: hypothetical protein KF893_11935 [Caldilineaceae bacterium]|nr:hypothetical protein [Caldilineaceae bacterium]